MSNPKMIRSRIFLSAFLTAFFAASGLSSCGGGGAEAEVTGTASPDTTPPVVTKGAPAGILASGTTSTTMSVITNEAAICKWGTSAGTSYASMANTFTISGGASHSTSLTGLTNQNYSRYVRCQDMAGNTNPTSYAVNFSVGNLPSNVFQAYFESESLGANCVAVGGGCPGGEVSQQKTEDPYNAAPVPPNSEGVNVTVVNSPTAPQGNQAVRLSRKSDDFTERRAQLSVYGISAMNALTTYYVHFYMYLPDTYTVYPWDGTHQGYLRMWEFIAWNGSQGLWHTTPGFFLKPGVANKLQMQFAGFGSNANQTLDFSGTVPANQWVKFVVKFTRGITDGAVTVWQDGVQVLNVSNLQTTYSGAETFFSLDASGMTVSPSPMTVYFDDVQINQANIW